MSKVELQIQDVTGMWRTVSTVINKDQVVNKELTAQSNRHKKTVRAVDSSGAMINIMPYVKGSHA
jgi:hypothetical protein